MRNNTPSRSRTLRLRRDLRINYELYLFCIPAVLIIFLFNYLPLYGVQIAFKNYTPAVGIHDSKWVGFEHFERFFSSYMFSDLMENTLLLSLLSIIIGFPFSILLALVFTQLRKKWAKNFTQTVAYLPHFISVVVMVGMIVLFLSPNNGIYGVIMDKIGVKPTNLMALPEAFRWIYVISDVWQHAGWDSIVYIAALSAVDTQLYDAAAVDGCNRWKRLWYIDLPCIAPTIIILLILRTGNIMSVGFEKAFLMQNSMNITTSEIISTYVYKIGMQKLQYSYSAAVGLFNSAINFVILFLVNQTAKKVSDISMW